LKKEIEVIEEKVQKLNCYRNSYRLRRCANKHPFNGNRCLMIERNVNASINILQMMINIDTKERKLYIEKNTKKKKKKTKKKKKKKKKKSKKKRKKYKNESKRKR